MGDDEKAVRNVIETWHRATEAGDVDAVLAQMADDVVFLTHGRPPFGKPEFAAASRASSGRFDVKVDAEVEEVSVAGSTATCRTRIRVAISPKGGAASSYSGRTLSVFRKEPDGRWLLTRDANLLAPETRPGPRLLGAAPVLQSASVATSADWYRTALGFSSDAFGPAENPVFAILRREAAEIMLQKTCGDPSPKSTDAETGLSVYLRVVDLQAVREAAITAGADAGPIESREYDCREFIVKDPDGHKIVVGECD